MQRINLTIIQDYIDKMLLILLGCFIVLWTLSIKKLIVPVYSDAHLNEFGSFFLYGSDIVATLFSIVFFIKYNNIIILSSKAIYERCSSAFTSAKIVPRGTIFIITMFFVAIFLKTLSLYDLVQWLKFLKIVLFAIFGYFAYLFLSVRYAGIVPRGTIYRNILAMIAGIGTINAVVGIMQFLKQSSLGLQFIGESVVGRDIDGVAKIDVLGHTILRSYGLLPHPNVLAGILVFSIAATIMLLFMKKSVIVPRGTIYMLKMILFVQIVALFLTFSRSAFLAVLISVIIMYLSRRTQLFHVEQLRKMAVFFVIMLIGIISFLNITLSGEAECSNSFTKSLCERSLYNDIAINALKDSFPYGIGTSVATSSASYTGQLLHYWQYQPVHNIFLLIIVENGIIFFAIIAIAMLIIVKIVPRGTISGTVLRSTIMIFLIIGCFDHYLWDIQQGFLSMIILSVLMAYSATVNIT